MKTKLTDRLKRLHGSRVRAQENDEAPTGVYEADPAPQGSLSSVPSAPSAPSAPSVSATHATAGQNPTPATLQPAGPVTAQLRRHEKLSKRSKPSAPKQAAPRHSPTYATGSGPQASSPRRAPTTTNDVSVGEQLAALRSHAKGLIDAGLTESALPLLHEMAALSPTNPFPLSELAKYHRAMGHYEIADLYESRLKAVSPF